MQKYPGEVVCVCGLQWGDEGKGKIVDAIAQDMHLVIRYQGGQNAGHTVRNEYGTHALNLLPSGVFCANVTNVIGPYVALDLERLQTELDALAKAGVPKPKLLISDRVRVVLPHHKLFDAWEEERLAGEKFGSTKTGIAPFYQQLTGKTGVPLTALLQSREVAIATVTRAMEIAEVMAKALYKKELPSVTDVVDELMPLAKNFGDCLVDTVTLCHDALKSGKNILCEAQLGAMRDVITGAYPMTTSSPTLAGFASAAAVVPAWSMTRIIGIAKAYTSKVGTGPLVTAFDNSEDKVADYIQNFGGANGEKGARTGRLRDIGWPDWYLTRYGAQCQGATEISITNMDVIGCIDEIKVCVAYELDGKVLNHFPRPDELSRVTPVYKTLPGWGMSKDEFGKCTRADQLPKQALDYIRQFEEFVELPVKLLSTGPARDQLIVMK